VFLANWKRKAFNYLSENKIQGALVIGLLGTSIKWHVKLAIFR
jgi:hypothetical protein